MIVPRLPGLKEVLRNPAVPPNTDTAKSDGFEGVGPERIYLKPTIADSTRSGYPPRPVPGSAVDMDTLMHHCDYTQGKVSIHDCLVRDFVT